MGAGRGAAPLGLMLLAACVAAPQETPTARATERRVQGLETRVAALSKAVQVLMDAAPVTARLEAARILAESAKREAASILVEALGQAAADYRARTGRWPPAENAGFVSALSEGGSFPMGASALDAEGRVVDPWGVPLRLRPTPSGLAIWSCGPDGKDDGGTGDDVK